MSLNIETHWTPDEATIKARTPDGIVRFAFTLGKEELVELASACLHAATALLAIEHLEKPLEVTPEEEEAFIELQRHCDALSRFGKSEAEDLTPDGRYSNG